MKVEYKNALIFLLAIALVVTIGGFFWKRNVERSLVEKNILAAKRKIFTVLSSPQAWQKTIEKNVNLHCANKKSGIACPPQVNIPFILFDADGSPVFDPKKQGFNFEGHICTKGENGCRVSLALNYIEVCNQPEIPCTTPDQYLVLGDFANTQLASGEELKLNHSPYSFAIQARGDDGAAFAPSPSGAAVSIAYKCPFAIVLPIEKPLTSEIKCLPMECPKGYLSMGVTGELVGVTSVGKQVVYAFNSVRICLSQ